jgi:hypothetical protein
VPHAIIASTSVSWRHTVVPLYWSCIVDNPTHVIFCLYVTRVLWFWKCLILLETLPNDLIEGVHSSIFAQYVATNERTWNLILKLQHYMNLLTLRFFHLPAWEWAVVELIHINISRGLGVTSWLLSESKTEQNSFVKFSYIVRICPKY